MIYQIWVHFIIFFMENHYQDWTNSWYAAEQTYKIAPCENHKKKDGGGEKTQKIRTLNCRGRIWQWKPEMQFYCFFSPFPWPLENTQIKSINGPWRRITLNCSIKPRNAENRREKKKKNNKYVLKNGLVRGARVPTCTITDGSNRTSINTIIL